MVIGLWPKITVKINFQNHLRIYLKKKISITLILLKWFN